MKAWRLLILGGLTTTIFGCSSPQIPPGSPVVPITTLEQIVGKWEGLSKRIPDMRNHAQVLLPSAIRGVSTSSAIGETTYSWGPGWLLFQTEAR